MNHVILTLCLVMLGLVTLVVIWFVGKYVPIVTRIFEEKPMLRPLKIDPETDGETVRFHSPDGVDLVGTYFTALRGPRVGVLVYCHEFMSNRWSFQPYVGWLRHYGYDIFVFDFRNHGESGRDPAYDPLQWVTRHELGDLRAALKVLRERPDRDAAGVVLFGVSRGGGTALAVAAKAPEVWGVITDGAFPTRGMMIAFIRKWAHIYMTCEFLYNLVPLFALRFLCWAARLRTQIRLGCHYANLERAVRKVSPRPWLAIHGEKDNYIPTEVAKDFFRRAGEPKQMWIVPKARHSRCWDTDPVGYREHVLNYLQMYAPRRPLEADPESLPPIVFGATKPKGKLKPKPKPEAAEAQNAPASDADTRADVPTEDARPLVVKTDASVEDASAGTGAGAA